MVWKISWRYCRFCDILKQRLAQHNLRRTSHKPPAGVQKDEQSWRRWTCMELNIFSRYERAPAQPFPFRKDIQKPAWPCCWPVAGLSLRVADPGTNTIEIRRSLVENSAILHGDEGQWSYSPSGRHCISCASCICWDDRDPSGFVTYSFWLSYVIIGETKTY